jgi:hypothetical protein
MWIAGSSDWRVRMDETHHACFTITGEFLTDISRQLWEEGKPDGALRILEAAFPDMPPEIRLAVALGHKRLTGDSNVGINVEDDASQTDSSLVIESMMDKYRSRIDKLEDEVQFFAGQTISISSPHGLIAVPERRTKWARRFGSRFRTLDGDWDLLDHIPWKRVLTENLDGYFGKQTETPPELKPEPAPPPKPTPPPAESKISADNGWLSPEGKFYRCIYSGHINLIDLLLPDAPEVFNKSEQAERSGWMKIQDGQAWDVAVHASGMHTIEVSQRQRDMVFDWYTRRDKELPNWMAPEED